MWMLLENGKLFSTSTFKQYIIDLFVEQEQSAHVIKTTSEDFESLLFSSHTNRY